jgi:NAD(P)-dependent dehydrogenase (short-subunit alcohol dehydrogenase family)
MDLGLAGKTVIVTGGGSNIGRAISLTFAKEGANVVIAELKAVFGEKAASEANALKAGGRTVVIETDVTKSDAVEATVKKTIEKFGRVDILVNNVGWDDVKLFVDTTPDLWNKLIDINYKGVLNCTKAVLPHMIEQKSGAIVSIGSDAGRMGEFKEAVYGGCKGAVIAFTKAVARETGRYGIRLNVVCPGMTVPAGEEVGEGSMWKQTLSFYGPEVQAQAAKNYPLRRIGKAQEVANAVVFLASDSASFITGQTLSASGGYTMM